MERPSTSLKLLDLMRSWEEDLLSKEEVADEIRDFGLELDHAGDVFIRAVEHRGKVPVFWYLDFEFRAVSERHLQPPP